MSAKDPTEDNSPMAVAARPTIRFISVLLKRNESIMRTMTGTGVAKHRIDEEARFGALAVNTPG